MELYVNGLGFIDNYGFGNYAGRLEKIELKKLLNDSHLYEKHFELNLPNFKRYDTYSKMACASVSIALKDSELNLNRDSKNNVGIIGFGAKGCEDSDRDFYNDFLSHGEEVASSNKFIYTLPTMPLSEAAIAFNLTGPLGHVTVIENSFRYASEMAQMFIEDCNADHILIGMFDKFCSFVLVGACNLKSKCKLKDFKIINKKNTQVS